MRKLKIIVLLIALISCTIGAKNKENQKIPEQSNQDGKSLIVRRQDFKTENVEFEEYLELIPRLGLPIEKMCYDDFVSTTLNQENKLIEKFKPEGANIYGKISINENVIAIIYLYPADYIFPYIVTYDSNAEKISELAFFDGNCGRDYDFYSSSFCRINDSLQISRIDSTTVYRMNENDETTGIKESNVIKSQYVINENGKIIIHL